MKVPFFIHNIGPEEIERVRAVLETPFLTTGPIAAEFERDFGRYLNLPHVILLSSCTAAIFLALRALGIGDGDEVITTPMSFVATANAILHTGARPVFVDVEPDTGNLDLSLVLPAITAKTKAIVPVHLYGQMVDMLGLSAIAKAHGLGTIEDSAHSIESARDGIRPGQLANAACFSFYATKNITCGEGGAIATSDAELSKNLHMMRLHGVSQGASERYTAARYQHYDMELMGYKFNLTDISAALLGTQLSRIEERLKRREEICRRYEASFTGEHELKFPKVLEGVKSARQLFTIWVKPERRDEIMWRLQQDGIGVAVNFRAIHLMDYYRKKLGYQRGNFPNAEAIGDSTISLPLYPKLTDDQVDYVIDRVRKALK